jgi:predicted GIY-YIG superfamily endonuclease
MYYVYILQSINHPHKTYIGITPDIANRLTVHNQGGSIYTSKLKASKLIGYIALSGLISLVRT